MKNINTFLAFSCAITGKEANPENDIFLFLLMDLLCLLIRKALSCFHEEIRKISILLGYDIRVFVGNLQ